MSLIEKVRHALALWPQPREKGEGVSVPTTCLYAGGGVVRVFVTGGDDSFKVHDNAGGIADFENCGGDIYNAPRLLASVFRGRGLMVDGAGRISSPLVEGAGLAAAIAIVANASREASDHLLERWKPVAKRKFKDLVEDLVSDEFPQRWAREVAIAGRSNKLHKFDFVVELGRDKQLLLDAVVPEATAINTAVVRHLDVREVHRERTSQRILYDDRLPWRSADLALLKIGAPPVAYASARGMLEHLH